MFSLEKLMVMVANLVVVVVVKACVVYRRACIEVLHLSQGLVYGCGCNTIMLLHMLQVGSMEYDDQREVVRALKMMEDEEEDGDLSLEAMDDGKVALVDGVFEGAFVALGDEWWCVGDGVLVSS
nr:hypothetical protein [Tanacetum cinerariifolium]